MSGDKARPRRRRGNGQGSVYQRADGVWTGAAYVLLADGTFKRRVVYGPSERVVSNKLVELQSNSNQGIPAEATSWTVERFLSHWLAHVVATSRKPKTLQGYEVVVRVHIVPELGRKRLHRLTGADVRLFVTRLENKCLCCLHKIDARRPAGEQRCCAIGECCKKLPSRRLVQQVHAVLRNALQAAVREELIRRNVAKLVQVSGPSYKVNRGLFVEQAKRLRDLAFDDRFYALYVLALYLGLRRGELFGLRWEDVDLDNRVLEVRRGLQRVEGKLQAVTPKTSSSERTLPLPRICVEALQEHRERQVCEMRAAGDDWHESGYVFTTTRGTAAEPDNLRRSWYPLRESAGLTNVRFHDLRHSCITLLLDLGVPPHIVQEIAGHAALGVTMLIYGHVSLAEKRRALDKLDERLR